MSKLNGEKARFATARRKKLERRIQTRAISKPGAPSKPEKHAPKTK